MNLVSSRCAGLVLACGVLVVAACESKGTPQGSAASTASAAPSATLATASAKPAGSTGVMPLGSASAASGKKTVPGAGKGAEPIPSKAKQAEYAQALAEGRKRAGEKKWTDAAAAFERAVAARPGDARAMAELGYAAGMAGDADKAAKWNDKALAAATDPVTQAQVHYNQGKLLDKQGKKDQARTHYERSIALRPNATVSAALAALGAPAGSCDKAFPSVAALCACYASAKEKREEIMVGFGSGEAKLACAESKEVKRAGAKASGLSIIRWGNPEDSGEHPWELLYAAAQGTRSIAKLGIDYEPGAFGVHNQAGVTAIETKELGGKQVAQVSWWQSNTDLNMAGMQLFEYETKNVTLCVLEDTKATCPITVVVEERNACSYPTESAEDAAELEDMKKADPPRDETYKASFSISDTGLVTIKETQGTRKESAELLKGKKLW
jgi:tetratricopeptide (TPR) repeat protein